MDRVIPVRTGPSLRAAISFVAIGVLLYLALLGGAEWLSWRNGRMNPILKIERAQGDFDWVILGASHAMPLDYDDFNAELEAASGRRILNLAGPGTGPLYNRLALEHFLRWHRTRHVLYVADAFAFRSRQWNEDRIDDPKLLARTPLSPGLAARLAAYVWKQDVDPRTLIDYATGFTKLNNRDRFALDVFEGEAQFDRVFKPSATADRKRIDYLYPPVDDEHGRQDRYFAVLAGLVDQASRSGADVALAKFPVPARFAALLPGEAAFDARLASFAAEHSLLLHDFSAALEGREYYADTDHLNREGVRALVERHLRALFGGTEASADQIGDRDAAGRISATPPR